MPSGAKVIQTAHSYSALPRSRAGRAVLVIHAWRGLNAFVRSTCERLADAGFIALAPDLYHGQVATTVEAARQLRSQLKRPAAFQQLREAAAALVSHPATQGSTLGVIGFSLGANYALWLTEQPSVPLSATVVYYGTRGGEYAQSQSAFLGHFAAEDSRVAASGVRKLERTLVAAGKDVTFFVYPATTHWFAEDDRAEAYVPEAASQAWQRTIEFLDSHIR